MTVIKKIIFALCLLLLLIAGVLFTLRNEQPVAVDFLFFQTPEWSLGLWLLLSLFSGAFLGVIASSFSLIRLQVRNRRLSRERDHQKHELQAVIQDKQ